MSFRFLKAVATVFFIILLFPGTSLLAQPGIPEFYGAGNEVHRWFFSFTDLVLILAAISGMLGGLRVYSNWQSGARHIDAQVMGWFFSCLFLLLIAGFLSTLYGIH